MAKINGTNKIKNAPGALILGLLLLAMLALGLYCQHQVSRSISVEESGRVVRIDTGASAGEIAEVLYEQGVIDKPKVFVLYSKIKGTESRLKAGTYLCEKGMSISELHRMLLSGNSREVRVIIPEGWTIGQVARRLKSKIIIESEQEFVKLCKDEEFLVELKIRAKTVEGYLYPDTYFFMPGIDMNEIVERMVGAYRKEVMPVMKEALSEEGEGQVLSEYDVLILASIVEREARNEEEKPTIASVYINRLVRKMKLESCATVRYALNKWNAALTMEDLRSDKAHNTYKHKGLPPWPICSPGKKSIEAVLRPSKTEYYFYCYKGDGTHHFSRTLSEHNKAVEKYIKGEAK